MAAAALLAATAALAGCGSKHPSGADTNQNAPGPPLPSGVQISIHPTGTPSGPTNGGPAQGGS